MHGQHVHAMNRRVDRSRIFGARSDYDRFASILAWAQQQHAMPITALCLMPNHWHLILRPQDSSHLSNFMHRLETTHAAGFRSFTETRGHGSLYGGRFKSFPIAPHRLLRSVVYVERNPVKAGLVDRATAWLHSSAASSATPPDWPQVTRLPHELERLRAGLLRRPLPEEFEAEFRACCASAVPRHVRLAESAAREVRGALASMDRERRSVQVSR
ncbi:MAG: transposase [Planctomycetota bacterium]